MVEVEGKVVGVKESLCTVYMYIFIILSLCYSFFFLFISQALLFRLKNHVEDTMAEVEVEGRKIGGNVFKCARGLHGKLYK